MKLKAILAIYLITKILLLGIFLLQPEGQRALRRARIQGIK